MLNKFSMSAYMTGLSYGLIGFLLSLMHSYLIKSVIQA